MACLLLIPICTSYDHIILGRLRVHTHFPDEYFGGDVRQINIHYNCQYNQDVVPGQEKSSVTSACSVSSTQTLLCQTLLRCWPVCHCWTPAKQGFGTLGNTYLKMGVIHETWVYKIITHIKLQQRPASFSLWSCGCVFDSLSWPECNVYVMMAVLSQFFCHRCLKWSLPTRKVITYIVGQYITGIL